MKIASGSWGVAGIRKWKIGRRGAVENERDERDEVYHLRNAFADYCDFDVVGGGGSCRAENGFLSD